IWRLQGQRGKGRETIGMRGAKFGELLVLDFHDSSREITFAVVPEGVDRQYLHIHALRIHRREPLLKIDKGLLRPNIRAGLNPGPLLTQQRAGFVKIAVSVHVDGLDPLAVDGDGQFLWRPLLGSRAVRETAAVKENAGVPSGPALQKITARRRHDGSLPGSCWPAQPGLQASRLNSF